MQPRRRYLRTQRARPEISQRTYEEDEAEAKRKSTTHTARRANVPKAKYLHWLHVFVCFFDSAISIACLVMG